MQLSLFPLSPPKIDRQTQIDQQIALLTRRSPLPPDTPRIVSYGGGTNSTAMIIALWLKGKQIDEILFADTGNEKPETYQFLDRFEVWLKSVGLPAITRIQYEIQQAKPRHKPMRRWSTIEEWQTPLSLLWLKAWVISVEQFRQTYHYTSLGEECLITASLPSKTYGYGRCSAKWKVEPMEKYVGQKYGCKVGQAIGIHAGELQRLLLKTGEPKPLESDSFYWEYPLVLWGMNQYHCQSLCQHYLGEMPIKSACWFCPNSRPSEVEWLKQVHPELYELGCFLEENAEPFSGAVKGLGRRFTWRNIGQMGELEQAFYEVKTASQVCGCVDG